MEPRDKVAVQYLTDLKHILRQRKAKFEAELKAVDDELSAVKKKLMLLRGKVKEE
jgi:hypothetical protein